MIFRKRKKVSSKTKLSIDGEPINVVDKTKFLGILIDNKLTWKQHIAYISGKISRGIGMIIKARQYLNKQGMLSLYYSFIYPYLTYCNHIWGSTYKSDSLCFKTKPLELLHMLAGEEVVILFTRNWT